MRFAAYVVVFVAPLVFVQFVEWDWSLSFYDMSQWHEMSRMTFGLWLVGWAVCCGSAETALKAKAESGAA